MIDNICFWLEKSVTMGRKHKKNNKSTTTTAPTKQAQTYVSPSHMNHVSQNGGFIGSTYVSPFDAQRGVVAGIFVSSLDMQRMRSTGGYF